jgi:hypothetical protein
MFCTGFPANVLASTASSQAFCCESVIFIAAVVEVFECVMPTRAQNSAGLR